MKPHKGRIVEISRLTFKDSKRVAIWCRFLDHPQFAGKLGHTSALVKSWEDERKHPNDPYEIETLNSRYTVVPGDTK